ncbi:class I SAM-dependent methyltransferase [Pelagibacteraceae bacterium]|nr:class I SAM-dependent methyltransferase [Pelagibacteraceae bacterium]
MKKLKNWDNKTWLSSKKYINSFNNFLKSKINLKNNTRILDIGCGRANIISALQKSYKFNYKAVGIDIVKNKDVKKNIIFKKIDAIKFLEKTTSLFDLILIKQTIHFFSKKQIKSLLNLAKKKLNKNGQILIFSLRVNKSEIPCFKVMRFKLLKSLKRDKDLLKLVKKNLNKYRNYNYYFKVNLQKTKYIQMIKNKYISCLLNVSKNEIKNGINEIKSNYKNQIKFTDTLNCISYKK